MNPHDGQRLVTRGPDVEEAAGAMVLLHGRGGSAQDILALADELGAEDWARLAPSAAQRTWYPYSFLAPREANEPGLSSGLTVVQGLIESLEQRLGSAERIVVLGFSQGGCLGLEAVVRRGRPIGAVVGLSSGLIGPSGTTWPTEGSLEGTVAFLGCSDRDPHIPRGRVAESTAVLRALGADVTERIYPGMGHTVNQDELDFVREIVSRIEQA